MQTQKQGENLDFSNIQLGEIELSESLKSNHIWVSIQSGTDFNTLPTEKPSITIMGDSKTVLSKFGKVEKRGGIFFTYEVDYKGTIPSIFDNHNRLKIFNVIANTPRTIIYVCSIDC